LEEKNSARPSGRGEGAELIPFAYWAQSSAVFPGQIKDFGASCYLTKRFSLSQIYE
jgi:hypothetical protein